MFLPNERDSYDANIPILFAGINKWKFNLNFKKGFRWWENIWF